MAVCIYQFPPFIPGKNKHVLSDQMYNCPNVRIKYNSYLKLITNSRSNVYPINDLRKGESNKL